MADAASAARCAAHGRRTIFLVEITDAPDALARLLCLFAVMQTSLAHVEMRRSGAGASVRLEIEGLDDHRAGVLARRLGGSIVVRAVSLGWRSA